MSSLQDTTGIAVESDTHENDSTQVARSQEPHPDGRPADSDDDSHHPAAAGEDDEDHVQVLSALAKYREDTGFTKYMVDLGIHPDDLPWIGNAELIYAALLAATPRAVVFTHPDGTTFHFTPGAVDNPAQKGLCHVMAAKGYSVMQQL